MSPPSRTSVEFLYGLYTYLNVSTYTFYLSDLSLLHMHACTGALIATRLVFTLPCNIAWSLLTHDISQGELGWPYFKKALDSHLVYNISRPLTFHTKTANVLAIMLTSACSL